MQPPNNTHTVPSIQRSRTSTRTAHKPTKMSISEFRKNKLQFVFNTFLDTNGSGTIDKNDFELAIEKACQLQGWAAGSSKHAETKETLLKIWEGLRQKADSDNDGQVSISEWNVMWDEYARDPSAALDWQQLYCKFVFDLEDASADGSIDSAEFTKVLSCYGIDIPQCNASFNKMAQVASAAAKVSNGRANVSWGEFQQLWKEFFSTEDASKPGNFIFGKGRF